MNGRIYADRFRIEAPRRPRPHATCWKAWQLDSGAPVELQLLLAEICGLPDGRPRFERTMRAAASVHVPQVATVTDWGIDDEGGFWLTMPFVEAPTLADLISDGGPLPPRRALALAREVVVGLSAIHEAGFLHGALTSQAIEVTGRAGDAEGVRLRDAGLGPLLAVAPVPDARIAQVDPDLPLLLAASGGRAVRRTGASSADDILALGGVLFEAVTGRRFFALLDGAGPTPLARERAIDSALDGVPAPVADLLHSLTAPRRDARIESAHAAQVALRHALDALTDDDGVPPALPRRPPSSGSSRAFRETALGMGPPAALGLTDVALAASVRRRPASEPVEQRAAADHPAREPRTTHDGDVLPPGRPGRSRTPTTPGGLWIADAEADAVGIDSATAPYGADHVATSVSTSPAAASLRYDDSERAARAVALGSATSPAVAGDVAEIASEAAAAAQQPAAGAAAGAPSRRRSAVRPGFDDVPLVPSVRPSDAADARGAAAARPVSSRDPQGDPATVGLTALPQRRSSRTDQPAAGREDAPVPMFGVRPRPPAVADPAAIRTTGRGGRELQTIEALRDDVQAALLRQQAARAEEAEAAARRAVPRESVAPAAHEPGSPSSGAAPLASAVAATPTLGAQPGVGASERPTRVDGPSPAAGEPRSALAQSASGTFVPWGAAGPPALLGTSGGSGLGDGPSFGGSTVVGADLDSGDAAATAPPASGERARPVSEAKFFQDDRPSEAPTAADAPLPRWPLALALAATAVILLWTASELGFLGSPRPVRPAPQSGTAPSHEVAASTTLAVEQGAAQSPEGDEPAPQPTAAAAAAEAPVAADTAAPLGSGDAPDDDEPPAQPADEPAAAAAPSDRQPEASTDAPGSGDAPAVAAVAAAAPLPSAPVSATPAPAPPAPAAPAPSAPAPSLPQPSAARPSAPPPPAPTHEPPVAARPAATPSVAAAATVKIAAGAYRVGCHPQLDGCERDAMPQHVVNLQALAVDADEVRSDLYAACVAQGACTPAGRGPGCNAGAAGHDAQPINCVDARQAASYCSWRGGRLPTEAEWESAARGGEVRRYPWGGPFPDCSRTTIASILGPGCGRQATTAAGDPPADTTPSGVRGLGGNVAEWTASPYAPYPDGAAFVSGDVVVRGGHFRDEAAQVPLTWQRRHLAPTTSSPTVGFRCFYDAGAPSLER